MAELDSLIRGYLFNLPVLGITIVVLILTFIGVKPIIAKFRKRLFAKMMGDFQDLYNSRTEDIKVELFSTLKDIESVDFALKNRGLIRILELGVGAGANLKHYPQNCRLIVVDPNPYFEQYFQENLKKFPQIFLERFVVAVGEDMSQIPDESVDAVVTTLVFCSVSNLRSVCKEILRILAPGGKFYYLEHILVEKGRRARSWQLFLSKSRIWPTFFDNCRLDRCTHKEILQCGFSAVDQKTFYLENTDRLALKLIQHHVVGTATK